MHRFATGFLAIALSTTALTVPAHAYLPSIGAYFDPDCATCSGNVAVGAPITIYVNVQLGGALTGGLVGAEFVLRGLPADWWILDVTPNPAANIVLGSPVGSGCNIAFPGCQVRAGGCINLYAIRVLPVSEVSNVALDVAYVPRPSDCHGPCTPLVWACDAPVYTAYFAAGGRAWINGPACSVGVSRTAWSRVKALYQAH